MAEGKETDSSPHGAVITVRWSVHRQMEDGKYAGGSSGSGQEFFEIKCVDKDSTFTKLKASLEAFSKEVSEDGKTQFDAARFEQAQVQGAGESQGNPASMFGMRGTISRGNANRPQRAAHLQVQGEVSPLR